MLFRLTAGVFALLLAAGPSAAAPTNLVPNGDFEAGDTGFSSDYQSAASNTAEGQYTVGANPQAWNGSLIVTPDHTEPGSLMFLGNGSSAQVRVWYTESIPVAAQTDYFFEAWVMNLCCRPGTLGNGVDPVGASVLSFYANDALLGTRSSSQLGVWEPLSTTWFSGDATSVTLRLVNSNLAAQGNDFAIDDVFLGTETSVAEPTSLALLGLGLAALARSRRRARA